MTEVENPHAGQGMVVLDIGGDIGALVVSTPATMAGVEIEICPTGARGDSPDEGGKWWVGTWRSHGHGLHDHADHDHDHDDNHDHSHGHDDNHDHDHAEASGHLAWPHVAVVGRPSPAGVQHAAVYPGLSEGTYDLWVRPDGPTLLTASVTGAQVTLADWPA